MLFVPLDVDYDSDDKVIEAGPMAELLFVRGLAFSKRKMSDGKITTAQLAVVGRAIPAAPKHAARLVELGLWAKTPTGWLIVNWAKRNKLASEIEDIRGARKEASARGNHAKWHVGPGRKPSATCRFCSDLGSQTDSQTESTESESESESEVKPEPEPETKEGQSSAQLNTIGTPPVDDDDFATALELIVDAKVAERQPDKPGAYRLTTRTNTLTEDGALIRALLDDGNTPAATARHILGEGPHVEPQSAPVPWCGSDCPDCHGDAWIDTGSGLSPCPQRTEKVG